MGKLISAGRYGGLVACALLLGCVSADGGPGEARGLFRTPSHVGELKPGPTAGWYVADQQPRYNRMGLASAAARGPDAVLAETASLPLPSIVSITNVATGATVRVRIDERAPLGETLVRLNAETAAAVGAKDEPLLVRVKFLEPAIVYRDRTPLRYAARRPAKSSTGLAMVPAAAVSRPAVQEDAPIAVARLERSPEPMAARIDPPVPAEAARSAAPAPAPAPAKPVQASLRVQAGAFANPANARRAVAMLTDAGPAHMEAARRAGGQTLYRVFVPCSAGTAEAVRAKVARAGFADARIVRSAI